MTLSSHIDLPLSRTQQKDVEAHSTYKLIIRTTLCASLFAIPFCVSIPSSPLLKLSQTQDAKKSLVPRMMSDFFYVNFIASWCAYSFIIEPRIRSEQAKRSFMPYLGPITAQVPAFSCLFASHLFYPGMWAIFNERTWRERRREFVRLNVKCFCAFSSIHIPATIAIGIGVGIILYPFKFFKK